MNMSTESISPMSWRFLLPPLPVGRVLCIAVGEGVGNESLEPVIDVSRFPLLARELTECLGCDNVSVVRWPDDSKSHGVLPFEGRSLAAVFVSGFEKISAFEGREVVGGNEDGGQTLLSEISRVLRSDGYVFLDVENKCGIGRLKELLSWGEVVRLIGQWRKWLSVQKVQEALKVKGFISVRSYPMIKDRDRVLEIIVQGGYVSIKNSTAWAERVKEAVWGELFIGFLANSFGIIGYKEKEGLSYSFLDCLLKDLTRREILNHSGYVRKQVYRYHVLHRKVILWVGLPKVEGENLIVILPLNSDFVERRRYEAKILMDLRRSKLDMARMVPVSYEEGVISGQSYFVLTEVPGVSIDLDIPQLQGATMQAARVLTEFHQATARKVLIGEAEYLYLIEDALGKVSSSLEQPCRARVAAIGRQLEKNLKGTSLDTVWMHGDFKIENVIFVPETFQVAGVIDWEQSRKQSLPLLDILYLLAYNHIIRCGGEVEDFLLQCLIPNKLLAWEQFIYDEYVNVLGVSKELCNVMIVMFWLYHRAYRVPIVAGAHPRIDDLIPALENLIGQC